MLFEKPSLYKVKKRCHVTHQIPGGLEADDADSRVSRSPRDRETPRRARLMPTPRPDPRLTGHRQLLHASTVTRQLLRGSVGHDEALHLRLVAPAPLTDGRLQHADHDAIEAEHEGEQRRDRDEAEDVLVCGAERPGGAEAGAGGGARAAGWL